MGSEEQLIIVGRVVLGAFLGYLIGLERSRRGKAAGDRTFALLAMGAAGFTAISIEEFPVSADRVIQGVAAGVGFLGAGVIFRAKGGGTRGLTTAAAMWASASIGVLTGSGAWLAAVLLTAVILLLLESHQVGFLRRLSYGDREPDEDED